MARRAALDRVRRRGGPLPARYRRVRTRGRRRGRRGVDPAGETGSYPLGGEPRADARARAARHDGRRPRTAALSVLRQPDGPRGARVPGNERASGAAGLSVPAALATGGIEVLGALPESSNAALLVRCVAPDDTCLAVYKPMRGEAPLWDFPDGTLHRREVAAFELARALGWPRVPPTVLREGPFGPGSVQLFISFDPSEHFFTLEVEHAETFRRVAMFDLAVNNADRKGGHCLLDEQREIWVIDHGVCFAVEPKLRTVIWTFVDEPLPVDAAEDLARVRTELGRGDGVAATLGALLAPDEVDATAVRIDRLLAEGRFPEPEPGVRPFPWPPI